MTKLIKYLIPLLVVFSFWSCADTYLSSVPENFIADTFICEPDSQASISSTESELSVPRQTSYSSACRLKTSARRTTGLQRTTLEFVKDGKLVNPSLRYFIFKKSIYFHSSLIEPALRLHYLGKLII